MINVREDLPESLKRILPTAGQEYFVQAYNQAYQKYQDPVISFRIAWDLVKQNFKVSEDQWVISNEDFQVQKLYVFETPLEAKQIIVNSTEEELIIDAILADTSPRKGDGRFFTEEALQMMADQINSNGSTLPDIEHQVMQALQSQFTPDEIPNELTQQKGVFNRIKAMVKDGKLWIKAWLDKAYEKIISLYKYLSIEALAEPQPDGSLSNPDYMGFTFTQKPRLPSAMVAAA